MEKQKRWQFYLILAVILLTLYNILPTVFFYSKPLTSPITEPRAQNVAVEIAERVNSLEEESQAWLKSFSRLLGVTPQSIHLNKDEPRLIEITFKDSKDADLFKRFLPRAGTRIPFVPAQLELYPKGQALSPNTVLVARQIGIHLDTGKSQEIFQYAPKFDEGNEINATYRQVINDRVTELLLALGGPSRAAQQIQTINENSNDSRYDEIAMMIARDIVEIDNVFGKTDPLTKRYFASFTQTNANGRENSIALFTSRLEALKAKIEAQSAPLAAEQKKLEEQQETLDYSRQETLANLTKQRQTLEAALILLKNNPSLFNAGTKPLTRESIAALLNQDVNLNGQTIALNNANPFVEAIHLNWNDGKISFIFFPEVQKNRSHEQISESGGYKKEKLNQLLINDMARVARSTEEEILPDGDSFAINLNQLPNTQSILVLNLDRLAQKQSQQLLEQIQKSWNPQHEDLISDLYPLHDYASFKKLSSEEQKLGLVVYAPGKGEQEIPEGFKAGSIYVIAKGMENILQKYSQAPESSETKTLSDDIQNLESIMRSNGFIGYAGNSYGIAKEFSKDYIFELNDFYSNLLKATREDFAVKGSKQYAVLDFSDVEQRILTRNKIDDRIQEDLLKWRDEYQAAQVDTNAADRYLIPAPTQSPFWENLKLSVAKYFRGDDRKILKWGLDLSGGKTVRIGLRDQNNRPVTNPEDLKQAVNELYARINKMGVSERTIHIENNNIVLDFPGSQNMSASELVKASAMYFHIVNEKFTPRNTSIGSTVNKFLQDVWNEAVVTNRKDLESINEIAWQHLGGDFSNPAEMRPLSEDARILFENGLRLANPRESVASSTFDDSQSVIGIMRGDDFAQWEGQSHPLMILFKNYALDGSSLTNVQPVFDNSQGYVLNFGVKRSFEGSKTGSPRDDFYTWTSQFAQDRIAGTSKEAYTPGRGWRMAVVLNGTIISKPELKASIRDSGTISGRFSQREINQLAADLKAGSLSFTPRILSEENVSPELGQEERTKGIVASLVAIALVVAAMISYYHFAGVVASCAVLFNILIMWGVLQNIGAAISLPGIAGIVLTIGMAVDANVLVFERIREEFKISGRIGSAIQAGYRKAFSAIFDSNLTTIIAALILIQFDSGPIKGFAVTLIIGIISSMFTALFVTRYYFAGWVRNPNNKQLTMSQFIGNTKFDFLAHSRKAIIASVIVMALGSVLFFGQTKTMFGMDFTGGYALDVELMENPAIKSYRLQAEETLLAHGATTNDFQIRELNKPNQLRIQLGTSMEEKGHPFYQLPETTQDSKFAYEFQSNPRINWLVNALSAADLKIEPTALADLDSHWTVISGQFSDAMRNNALIGLTVALACILLYITMRFEFKYAIAAVIGLVHDVIITLGVLALFHWMGFAVQIDLQVIGAIMTIIGYSLNDTIIVFDRIREDLHILRKMKYEDVINHALNVTLSRTIMTSGTTLIVLLALVFLGGKSIFAFSLVMTIGVVVGTLSSLFIAAPALLYFHNREVRLQELEMQSKKA